MRRRLVLFVAALALVVGGTTAPAYASHPARLSLTSVSNPHPDLISGGNLLVRVSGATTAPSFDVDGHARAIAAHAQGDGSYLALVGGLSSGRHEISAVAGHHRADLRVRDFSINGPVFSGPQQLPFICETTAYGLAPATQPECAAPTQVSYQYKNTAGAFVPLADPTARPADLATAQVDGRSVPYIVRLEQGTIDRAVYQIAALYAGSQPVPWTPGTSWNRRLVYTFGGGCDAGFHQGSSTGGVINDLFLAQGYAVASSSLNVLDNNCSTIISAEAAMMVKEHFIEEYGPVAHTIGWGGSGGAIQQYDIADQYPGILDGIVPGISFPDPFTTLGPVTDCRLLDNFFGTSGNGFSADQQREVAGFNSYDSCQSWDATFANRITATDSCNAAVPVSLRWDPVTNPDGVKCSAAEQYVNQLGVDRRTGFPRSVLDNVGVQYGLTALQKGQISAQQFADLNAAVGGFDYTGKPVPQRSRADSKALSASYRDDLVNSGGQGLADTAVIDQRIDLDLAGFGNDIHTTDWSYVMRARMTIAGTVGNQVIIEDGLATVAQASVYELTAMDQWLDAIDADTSHRSLAHRVSADKPGSITDGCFLDDGTLVHETLSYAGSGQCASAFPVASNTRLSAGEPLSMTVLKCSLAPLDFRNYPVSFTAAEKSELRAAFPTGVCDYNRRGVDQQRPAGIWLNYGT
ncbi:MAG TPA: DUF6351 family protein [Micromonosporaceae bacterium]